MFNFSRKQKKYPSFNLLTSFHKRNAYFTRNAEWGWLDTESIFITDPVSLEVFRPTSWPQAIFIHANGDMTVAEFVHFMASKYTAKIPSELDQAIIMELLKLSDRKLIMLVDNKQKTLSDFDLPKFNVK
jgi:hypothetical protein